MNSKFDQSIVAAGDLKALLTEKPETVLIDLLSPEHFASRHIPGAQNACVFQVSFLDDLAVAAPDKQVPNVIYGSTRFFEHLGMHKVFDLISVFKSA